MNPHRRFLGLIGVTAIALFAVSLRFSSPEFRAWEVLKRSDFITFEPDQIYEGDDIGDLGYKSWVRALQRAKHVRFTTDRWGFRNSNDVGRPTVVVLGDSYTVGSGVSDDQTLPARLAARLGATVYNYGLETGATPALFLADDRFKQAPPAVVIYAPVGRLLRPRSLRLANDRWPTPTEPQGPVERYLAVAEAVKHAVTAMNRDNGLAVGARYALNGLRYRLGFGPFMLHPEGQPALALTIKQQYLDVSPQRRGAEPFVRMLAVFQALLKQRGIELVFAPVPDVGTIYPDLYPPEEQARIFHPSMFDVVIDGARQSGVVTTDLRIPFVAERSPYLYQPDDSHWNSRAIDLAAQALAETLAEKGWVRSSAIEPPPEKLPPAGGAEAQP